MAMAATSHHHRCFFRDLSRRHFFRRRQQAALPLPFAQLVGIAGVMDLCRRLFPVGEGSHATPSEFPSPGSAIPKRSSRSVASAPRSRPTGPILDADDYRRRFPDGRIGSDPSQASIEAGEKIVSLATKGVIQEFRQFAAA